MYRQHVRPFEPRMLLTLQRLRSALAPTHRDKAAMDGARCFLFRSSRSVEWNR
jgi:hypothetical protein